MRRMKILFDLKHPAQVHFFRHVIESLRTGGHEVLVTSRDKDETLALLAALGIENVCLSRMRTGLVGMGMELVLRTSRMLLLALRRRPDVLVARTGISVGIVGRLIRRPCIDFDDTEFASLQIRLSAPLATVICTGLGCARRFGRKERRFNAPPHLAYTHPSRFQPDPGRLRACGIEPDEPYVVIRLKAWRAIHDRGVEGAPDEEIVRLVRAIEEHARPVVSSERELPDELKPYTTPAGIDDSLHLLALARLYVGEGSCMAAEAACLGTPAVFLSPSSRRGYLDEIEKRYGHVTTVQTAPQAIEECRRRLVPACKAEAVAASRRLVEECDDPVGFMFDTITGCGRAGGHSR